METAKPGPVGITRWLRISHLTLKVHHAERTREPGIDALHQTPGGTDGNVPGDCNKALYGAELWWDDREGSKVKNRRVASKAAERGGKRDDGELPEHQSGFVMAESGLRPAESLLNNRSWATRPDHCRALTRRWGSE